MALFWKPLIANAYQISFEKSKLFNIFCLISIQKSLHISGNSQAKTQPPFSALNKQAQKSPITSVISTQNQSNNRNNIAQNSVSTSTSTTSASSVKQFRHKIVSCKPFCQSKATECYPSVRDASTQVDLDEIKLQHTIVPVPVPVNVPIPMFMYQAVMPVPILLPVPIPIPVFIATTKKTHDRVERRIRVSFF